MFELVTSFIANLSKFWVSGSHMHRRLVLKLTFAENLSYCRKSGFRTPELGEHIKWEKASRKALTAVSLDAQDVKRARSLCKLPNG